VISEDVRHRAGTAALQVLMYAQAKRGDSTNPLPLTSTINPPWMGPDDGITV